MNQALEKMYSYLKTHQQRNHSNWQQKNLMSQNNMQYTMNEEETNFNDHLLGAKYVRRAHATPRACSDLCDGRSARIRPVLAGRVLGRPA